MLVKLLRDARGRVVAAVPAASADDVAVEPRAAEGQRVEEAELAGADAENLLRGLR